MHITHQCFAHVFVLGFALGMQWHLGFPCRGALGREYGCSTCGAAPASVRCTRAWTYTLRSMCPSAHVDMATISCKYSDYTWASLHTRCHPPTRVCITIHKHTHIQCTHTTNLLNFTKRGWIHTCTMHTHRCPHEWITTHSQMHTCTTFVQSDACHTHCVGTHRHHVCTPQHLTCRNELIKRHTLHMLICVPEYAV